MEEVLLKLIALQVVIAGSLAIVSGLLWLSFKLLTYILKLFGVWKDTLHIAGLYYRMKRVDKYIKHKGVTYVKKEVKGE